MKLWRDNREIWDKIWSDKLDEMKSKILKKLRRERVKRKKEGGNKEGRDKFKTRKGINIKISLK